MSEPAQKGFRGRLSARSLAVLKQGSGGVRRSPQAPTGLLAVSRSRLMLERAEARTSLFGQPVRVTGCDAAIRVKRGATDIGLRKLCISRRKEDPMPEQGTVRRARRDLKEGKSPSTAAGEFVHKEIEHVREGTHGARSAQQATAIGLSKARKAGVPLRSPKKGKTKESTRKSAEPEYHAGQSELRRIGSDVRIISCEFSLLLQIVSCCRSLWG